MLNSNMQLEKGTLMKFDETMLAEMRKTILPAIVETTNAALRAHTAAEESDGKNYMDNYTLGCACWRNLFNRLNDILQDHPFFHKKTTRQVMEISCPNGEETFSFFIYRVVDEEIRIPKGGKSVKAFLEQQLWLTDDIKSAILRGADGVNILGYDVTIESGLGRITLDRLIATDKRHYEPQLLHDFGMGIGQPDGVSSTDVHGSNVSTTPEEISKPAVNMDREEAQSKKSNG